MSKLNFMSALAAVSISAGTPTKEVKEVKETKSRVEKNPTNGADFRILANGKVYPSAAFVEEFGLEYQPKNGNMKSMGLDIFDSSKWSQLAGAPQMLLAYVVDQSKPKVELFAGTRYKEDGTPINSVMEQGTVVSNETLELIAVALGYSHSEATHQVMGTETKEEVPLSAWEVMLGNRQYVDFYLMRNASDYLKVPDNTYLIPKAVNRGADKGTLSTVKRENLTIFPIVEYTQEVIDELNQEAVEDNTLAEVTAEDADGEGSYQEVDIDAEEPVAVQA